MILKIVFLLLYFLLVFIAARLFEFYTSSVVSWECLSGIIPAIFENLQDKPQEKHDKSFDHSEESSFDTSTLGDVESTDSEQGNADNGIESLQIASFSSYRELEDTIEDATNIWVLQVKASNKWGAFRRRKWKMMSRRLRKTGINIGTYKCSSDSRFCIKHRIYFSTVILVTPKGYQVKGNVEYYVFPTGGEPIKEYDIENTLMNWIKSKLNPKVRTVHSFSELTERPLSRRGNIPSKASMYFVYKSNERVPPLLFSTLSVKFSGRIKFYMFKTKETLESGNVFAMNPSTMYRYGERRGEYFTYSCVELFLRTLHPEMNDIFVVSIILLNMACWLELFVQKGGPIKRLFYYVWGFAIANIFLVSIWLLLIQLLYMPQVQPIIELCLKNFQHIMFTNIAAIVRQDIIQLSKHIHIVISGFVGYGIILGYLHYKLRNSGNDRIFFTSVMDVIHYDIEEIKELFYSLIGFITPSLRIYRFEEGIERILHRLAVPDLWLHAKYPNDYIHGLPTWTFSCNELNCAESVHMESIYEEDMQSDGDGQTFNYKMMQNEECVVCLDTYKCGDVMRGLPCGHCFHRSCIDSWLIPNNHVSDHRCPVCRWPADIDKKGSVEVIDMT